MKDPQATIRDIALKLNVSISTVSRAIRGVPEVNPETRKAVLEMAAKLNYEPNRVAQSLRIKKTNTLGIIVPEIAMHFFSSAISGMQEYAAQHGYSIMICQSMESLEIEKSNIHMLVSNRVDGLLISLSSETKNVEHLQQLIQKKIPMILFDRVHEDIPVSKVVVDDHDGAFKAVDYLIKTGCKRIAHIGGPLSLYISSQRKKGYLDALAKNNIPVDEALIAHCDNLQVDPIEATKKLLKQKPDALFCMNDPIAILAMQVLKEEGIKIPQEISVVGFTNEPVSSFIEPSLTTVAQPSHEMGMMATKLLIDQMESEEPFTPITKVIDTQLIIRNSTRK
ncbi:MAG TPA: LacI family DNA-binding transcriptional regulator [Cyclobacteriaceae bacterium]|nr:LacI family DNA-binding transcriptional regulator [Cyclobacteriaceae bacterium]